MSQKELIKLLSNTGVGKTVKIDNSGIEIKIMVEECEFTSYLLSPCKDCFFKSRKGKKCEMLRSCVTPTRRDRESVYFKPVN
ncbi:hypothetical protein EZS27_003917 [termite gut metagenome]|uniref:Uncharacterized protein n=1 Tax=termite gut metagenome TaxID=433724 RepID=A0A5J4SR88_9ZZZZ